MTEEKQVFPDGVHEERRHFPRLAASVDIEYTILEKESPQLEQTLSKNISAGGICLIVYERVEIGSILELKIHLSDINCDIRAKGKVIWSSYFTVGTGGPDRYDLGIEFVDISESDRQKISQYVFKLL